MPQPPHHRDLTIHLAIAEECGQQVGTIDWLNGGDFDSGNRTESRQPIGTVDRLLTNLAGTDPAWPAHNSRNPDTSFVDMAFCSPKIAGTAKSSRGAMLRTVIRSEYYQSVFAQAMLVEVVHQATNMMIQHGNAAKVEIRVFQLRSTLYLWASGLIKRFEKRSGF